MVEILEERPDQILVLEEGNPVIYPNNAYWNLKLKMFNGNRIIYKFEDGLELIETYDNQIFNCTYNGETIQMRQNAADNLALSVKHHMDTKDAELFRKLFTAAWGLIYKEKVLQILLAPYPNVVETDDGFVVNDFFMVDRRGEAKAKDIEGKWYRLCVVLQDHVTPQKIQTVVGTVEIDVLAQTILAKVLFLLHPNLSDSVFMNQLPEYVTAELKRAAEEESKKTQKNK